MGDGGQGVPRLWTKAAAMESMGRVRGVFPRREDRTATRASFVDRLRDWRQQTTWGEFLSRYGRMVHRVALRAGLRPHEADEVVQETALSVARAMPQFVYEPGRCSFEGWVRRMARLRISDQIRRRGREDRVGAVDGLECDGAGVGHGFEGEAGDDPGLAGMELAAPDPTDAGWQEEWKRMVLERALERVRLAVSPEHYQIFHLAVLEERAGVDVARMLDVSLAKVYVVRHRLLARLHREVKQARRESDAGLPRG